MVTYRKLCQIIEKKPLRFVVVDDDDLLLRIWRRVLSIEKDCLCFFTTDPTDALEELKKNGADILITDLYMPQMNGRRLIDQALTIEPKLKVYLTTGHMGKLDTLKPWGKQSDVLQKPYCNIHLLQSFIHNMIAKKPFSRSHLKTHGQIFVWSL